MSNKNEELPLYGGTIEGPEKRRRVLKGKRFVFTAAQNNTLAHPGFLASLRRFCKKNKAQLVISPFLYNKNGFQNGEGQETWYDPALKPHFIDEAARVSNKLLWAGELNILPTAVSPLTSLKSYSRGESMIVPHAKVALESVPRILGSGACIIWTTGAITQRNYIQMLAGQKAEFHHSFGAIYVEIDHKGQHFCRHLLANEEGVFQDLTHLYTPNQVRSGQRVEAVQWGDLHSEKINKANLSAMHDMLTVLRPKYQFIHDALDFGNRNHHRIDDPLHLAQEYFNGRSVEKDIEDCKRVIVSLMRKNTETVVVASNHDLALIKWLSTADIRKDPANAWYFHMLNTEVHRSIRWEGEVPNIFKYAFDTTNNISTPEYPITWLDVDDSFVICNKDDAGIECANHGHLGPNGSRGSAVSFGNIGMKMNQGHIHSPYIRNGAWGAGIVSKLNQGYNHGPSGWAAANIITYPSGKRSMVFMAGDRWRA